MSDERLKRGVSRIPVSAGVTDDSNLEVTQLRVDPTTKRLKVATTTDQEQFADNASVTATDKGNLVLGTDGSNYQILKVNSDGELITNLETADIEIGAVEIKDHDGTDRTAVNASNELQVRDDDANTDLDTLAGAVSGTEMQVDVVAALPAGDNNIGNVDIASSVALDVSAATVTVTDDGNFVLAANDGVDIGDVSVNNTVSTEQDGTALGNGQVSVDTTAGGVQIVAASAGRYGVDITNQGSTDCYVGTGSVSNSNGFLLGVGESIFLPTDSEVKAVTSSSSTTVGFLSYA